MAPGVPVIEIVTFRVSDKYRSDPAHFEAVRVHLERYRGKGMNGQYWGQTVERPHILHWVILWDSREAHGVLEAEPTYPTFDAHIHELAKGPVNRVHVHLLNHDPAKFLEAPVTEFDFYTSPESEHHTNHGIVQGLIDDLFKTQPAGYLGGSWGLAMEDHTQGAYISGWVSIEEHMKMDMGPDFGKMAEDLFGNLSDLQVMHVVFQRHN